jgi:Protein of unknown function C-terminus (DUF2399)
VRYHGDFDGEGVRIAGYLGAETGATPWRMSADDYRSHVADHGAPVGRVTEAPWDEGLAPVMIDRGVAVLEETVWDVLLPLVPFGRTLPSVHFVLLAGAPLPSQAPCGRGRR